MSGVWRVGSWDAASTLARLYSSTSTRTRHSHAAPYAAVHVALATVLGYVFAVVLPPAGHPGLGREADGIGGLAGWTEMLLLRRTLNRRIGHTGLASGYLARLWVAAGSAAGAAWGLKLVMPPLHPALTALVVLTPYGAVFLACTLALGLPEASNAVKPILRRR